MTVAFLIDSDCNIAVMAGTVERFGTARWLAAFAIHKERSGVQGMRLEFHRVAFG